MGKKTWNEKLDTGNGLPKTEPIEEGSRMGPGVLLVPSPREVDAMMKKPGPGELLTSDLMRKKLAEKHGATFTCPMTTGIFMRIAAYASDERSEAGNNSDLTPYWRTLKAGGELNEKYPGGIPEQQARLEMEGHTVCTKGKKSYVQGYQARLIDENRLL